MTGVEFDFVVWDSLSALDDYKYVFDIEVLEKTEFEKGQNEVVFSLYDTRFHMLDENPDFSLFAPKEGSSQSSWFNISVESISDTFDKAIEKGWTPIQGITHIEDFGVSNAILLDNFGYVWMLHEIHEIVSFEDRVEYFENKMK